VKSNEKDQAKSMAANAYRMQLKARKSFAALDPTAGPERDALGLL
jgi:hypothetical protein